MGEYITVVDTQGHTHLLRRSAILRVSQVDRVDGYSYTGGWEVVLRDGLSLLLYAGAGATLNAALVQGGEGEADAEGM